MTDLARSREYRRFALASSALLFLFGFATIGSQGLPTVVYGAKDSISFETIGISWAFCAISVLLTSAAPVAALRLPWAGFLLAIVVPAWLVWIYHVWAFTSFVGLLLVAAVTMGRSIAAAMPMAALSMVFPLSLLGEVTMTMPDRAEIYLHFGGDSTAGNVTFEIGYGVLALLVLGAGMLLRRYVAERGVVVRDAAVLSERARLARDLHDVVAHHVSLIAVRAETAPYTVSDLGAGGRTAMADIATEARLAMTELREVLGVLRRADEGVALAPQPTGADVAALIADAACAGEVVYVGDEHLTGLPAPVGYAAYRLVQEALTNARRHATGATVSVTATRVDDAVVVQVINAVPPGTVLQPGAGLAGMRERVEAIGGEFQAGVTDAAALVQATFPSKIAT